MFALLFDRKSLTMTLLALGGMGLLLFVFGFALGSYLNGGLEHLGVIAQEVAPTNRPQSASRTAAPASRRGTGRAPAPDTVEVEVEDPVLPEPAAGMTDEMADERGDGLSGPPADWVPLEEGGAWPGEQGGTEEILTVEPARTQTAALQDPEMTAGEPAASGMTSEMSAEMTTAAMDLAEPAAPASSQRVLGFYYVQLGTFSREELALEKRAEVESRIAKQEDEGVAPFLAQVTDRSGRPAFAVRVGPFPTRGAAREAAAGFGPASVVWSSSGRAL